MTTNATSRSLGSYKAKLTQARRMGNADLIAHYESLVASLGGDTAAKAKTGTNVDGGDNGNVIGQYAAYKAQLTKARKAFDGNRAAHYKALIADMESAYAYLLETPTSDNSLPASNANPIDRLAGFKAARTRAYNAGEDSKVAAIDGKIAALKAEYAYLANY